MKQLFRLNAMCLLLAAVFTLTGCNHKELCLDHIELQRVKIEFDWEDAPEATPGGMAVFFYAIPTDDNTSVSTAYQRADFKGKNGGFVEIPRGAYRIICYSNDSEVNLFHDITDFDKHTAYTRRASLFESLSLEGSAPLANGQENQRIVLTPDQLWGSNHPRIEIIGSSETHTHDTEAGKTAKTAYDPETGERIQVITLKPHEMTCHYTYEIRNVKNLKHVDKLCAAISGMSPSLKAASEEIHTEPVTLPLSATSDGKSLVSGSFHTFGHHTSNAQPHIMTLYVWMDDGRKFVYGSGDVPGAFDVTRQVENAPNRRRVHLVIDGLELPQPVENGSGYHPSVDGWDTVETDIIM